METGFLCIVLAFLELTLKTTLAIQLTNTPDSASQVLGLKACDTNTCLLLHFLMHTFPKGSRSFLCFCCCCCCLFLLLLFVCFDLLLFPRNLQYVLFTVYSNWHSDNVNVKKLTDISILFLPLSTSFFYIPNDFTFLGSLLPINPISPLLSAYSTMSSLPLLCFGNPSPKLLHQAFPRPGSFPSFCLGINWYVNCVLGIWASGLISTYQSLHSMYVLLWLGYLS